MTTLTCACANIENANNTNKNDVIKFLPAKRPSPDRTEDDEENVDAAKEKKKKKKKRKTRSFQAQNDSEEDRDDQDYKWERQILFIQRQWEILDIGNVVPKHMRPIPTPDLINYPGNKRGVILTELYKLAKTTKGKYEHVVAAMEEHFRKRGGRTLSKEDVKYAYKKLVQGIEQRSSLPAPVQANSQVKVCFSTAQSHQQPLTRGRQTDSQKPPTRPLHRPAHANIGRSQEPLQPNPPDDQASLKLRIALRALRTAETACNLACDNHTIAYFKRDEVEANLKEHDRNVTVAEQEINFTHTRVDSARRRLLNAGGGEESESDRE
jgi:hypothetical protein